MQYLRWGTNEKSSSRDAVHISPLIHLPQFTYKDYKLFVKEFKLTTGIKNLINNKKKKKHYEFLIYSN